MMISSIKDFKNTFADSNNRAVKPLKRLHFKKKSNKNYVLDQFKNYKQNTNLLYVATTKTFKSKTFTTLSLNYIHNKGTGFKYRINTK